MLWRHPAPLPPAAMAARSSLNAKNLAGLGAARLAALLMEVTEGSPAARRTLRLALAENQGPNELAQEVRKRLAAVERSNRWLETRDRDALLLDLERQRQVISRSIAREAPALALELLWRFLELGTSVRDRCEDSDERALHFFQALSAELGAVARLAGPSPEALVDQVAAAVLSTHMGQYDCLIVHLAPALHSEGLQSLRARMEAERPATPPPPAYWVEEQQPDPVGEDEDEDAGVCTRSGLCDLFSFYDPEWMEEDQADADGEEDAWRDADGNADFEPKEFSPEDVDQNPSVRHQRVRIAMLAIADGLGDAEAYWAEYRDHLPAALRRPRLAARVARRLTAAGQPERALAVLDGVPLRRGPRADGYRRWLDARLMALEAQGQQEEAQRLRLDFALDRLSLPHLRDHLSRLPAFEDEQVQEEALDTVLRHPNAPAALAFLHRWPDRRRTARLILERPEQLHGRDEHLLESIVGVLEGSQPLAATVCLRLMVEFILETGQTNRYKHAARHVASCRRLAPAIDDWGRIPPHNVYARNLLRDYDHRTGFIRRLELDALQVEDRTPGP
ncbi:MAG: DUF6880 family protein [Cyanobacteriota bacterium]